MKLGPKCLLTFCPLGKSLAIFQKIRQMNPLSELSLIPFQVFLPSYVHYMFFNIIAFSVFFLKLLVNVSFLLINSFCSTLYLHWPRGHLAHSKCSINTWCLNERRQFIASPLNIWSFLRISGFLVSSQFCLGWLIFHILILNCTVTSILKAFIECPNKRQRCTEDSRQSTTLPSRNWDQWEDKLTWRSTMWLQ